MALERQHVLSKSEQAVMRAVLRATDKNTGACLLTPIDIFQSIPLDVSIEENELDSILRDLEIDDYFELIRSEKKGELVYCLNLHKKGLQYARVEKTFKSNVIFRLVFACCTATVGAIVGCIIKYVIVPAIAK